MGEGSIMLYSLLAAVTAAGAGKSLVDYSSERTAALQDYISLARQSGELADARLEAAETYARELVSPPLDGIFVAAFAGYIGGVALCKARRKEDE